MNSVFQKIRAHHGDAGFIAGRSYYMGAEVKHTAKYLDTGNEHEVSNFCWFEYTFDHSRDGVNARKLFSVMYDYKATSEQKEWFGEKCSDLFRRGFSWSEGGGSFSLTGVWSCYWEQVNNADKQWWKEYLEAIDETILKYKSQGND